MTCFETNALELSLLLLKLPSSLSSTSSTKLDEFIPKPFSIDKLTVLIKKHVLNGTKAMSVVYQDSIKHNDLC
jgi:hypothetical protein